MIDNVTRRSKDSQSNLLDNVTRGRDENASVQSNESKRKKEVKVPMRLSKRLAGVEPEAKPSDKALEYSSKKSSQSLTPHPLPQVIRTRKEELKKAEYKVCDLGRLLDKSLMDKKEIKLDFEAQIRDLRDALKKCEEKLSREILQKEEAERNCHHLRTA
ncbi:hypothetical protein KIW84_032815 [Lathyrus oleraceus]|uniref:Uncharacterized protein n=1 Tax=Pisum sativum TaxID=3888 RepID=A0A9D5AZ67_PEA|nr:hypothetical protein KIW84_032815 [Pisum sativum]